MYAEKPHKDIYSFVGRFSMVGTLQHCSMHCSTHAHTFIHTHTHTHTLDGQVAPNDKTEEEPLGTENTLWANTVLASGIALILEAHISTRGVI